MDKFIRIKQGSNIQDVLIDFDNSASMEDLISCVTKTTTGDYCIYENLRIPSETKLSELHITPGTLFEFCSLKERGATNIPAAWEMHQLQQLISLTLYNPKQLILPSIEEETIKLPKLPENKTPQKLPLISLLAPLIMASVMMLIMPNPMSLIYFALTPLIMLGTWFESRRTTKKLIKTDKKKFLDALSKLETELDEKVLNTKNKKFTLTPTVTQILNHLDKDLFWNIKPTDPNFLNINLGLYTATPEFDFEEYDLDNCPDYVEQELLPMIKKFQSIENCPYKLDLKTNNILGIFGSYRLQYIDSIVFQLISSISPKFLNFNIIVNHSTIKEFDYLKETSFLTVLETQAERQNLIGKVFEQVSNSNKTEIVIIEADYMSQRDLSNLTNYFQDNLTNVVVIWFSIDEKLIPNVCKATIDTDCKIINDFIDSKESTLKEFESVDYKTLKNLASKLAKHIDSSDLITLQQDIPNSCKFDILYPGVKLNQNLDQELNQGLEQDLDHLHSLDQVQELEQAKVLLPPAKVDNKLLVPIGVDENGIVNIDIKTMGPHTLIGGTTGAGKSELLKTWITSLALSYTPEYLNFLLVDYKGGSAFSNCVQFPHTVGLLTDLNAHLTNRVLTSLTAEIKYRERLLAKFNCKDIGEFHTLKDEQNKLAYLVIVIDEFASLVHDSPDFVNGIVDIAARGRSLGIHLILATQRPAGVITDNIKANTNLRIALRVSDPSESTDIISTPDAYDISESLKGRALIKTGSNKVFQVQSGYLGYSSIASTRSNIGINYYKFDNLDPFTKQANQLESDAGARAGTGAGAKQIKPTEIKSDELLLSEAIINTYRDSNPRKPWQNPLPNVITPNTIELGPGAGAGAGAGAGTIGVSDDVTNQRYLPATINLIKVQNLAVFGGIGSGKTNTLRVFMELVKGGATVYSITGSVTPSPGEIHYEDFESIDRLFNILTTGADSEARLGPGAGTGAEPNVKYVFIDNFESFKTYYEKHYKLGIIEKLTSLLETASQFNNHFIFACSSANSINQKTKSLISEKIILKMSDDLEYSYLGLTRKETEMFSQDITPGRCFFNRLETQLFLSDTSQFDQNKVVQDNVNQAKNSIFTVIEKCPTSFTCSNVYNFVNYKTLEKTLIAPGNLTVIMGNSGSGKSAVAKTLFFDSCIIIENFDSLEDDETDDLVVKILQCAKSAKFKVIIKTSNTGSSGLWQTSQKLKNADTFILLNADEKFNSRLFPGEVPKCQYVKAPGRGYIYESGNFTLGQFGVLEQEKDF
jgi:S-DNA-T family DNA segregation ATPase FtsK/SpoIIIE